MTLEAATETVREQDPDRFGAVLAAAPDQRPALVTLYALNLELARAPFQSAEPMLAEMRLQWWVDRLAEMGQGTEPPLHDVLTPLWESWGTSAGAFADLAEARRRDCAREPFTGPDEVIDYIDATSGRLMWFAAQRLGANTASQPVVADHARGVGLAAWLRALHQLQPLGLGFQHETPEHAVELAKAAQESLRLASRRHKLVAKQAAAALYPGPRIPRLLAEIASGRLDPYKDASEITPFQRRASLARLALTGRWWR
ncbi:squalene/phytoene synthase family protein [Paracoccus caeni]|uniref:Squalene/phytoene synthase family protein n=1 Tax=Paracoccus caeni TaxID=657651 RepID=A0A934SE16_9RHOB|nr:squalene/phytoene synthase family protein [Paracoccus caeni]MBK4215650.1 squalene/phytoene synthase family protein [Paracoccus caeni]